MNYYTRRKIARIIIFLCLLIASVSIAILPTCLRKGWGVIKNEIINIP